MDKNKVFALMLLASLSTALYNFCRNTITLILMLACLCASIVATIMDLFGKKA